MTLTWCVYSQQMGKRSQFYVDKVFQFQKEKKNYLGKQAQTVILNCALVPE